MAVMVTTIQIKEDQTKAPTRIKDQINTAAASSTVDRLCMDLFPEGIKLEVVGGIKIKGERIRVQAVTINRAGNMNIAQYRGVIKAVVIMVILNKGDQGVASNMEGHSRTQGRTDRFQAIISSAETTDNISRITVDTTNQITVDNMFIDQVPTVQVVHNINMYKARQVFAHSSIIRFKIINKLIWQLAFFDNILMNNLIDKFSVNLMNRRLWRPREWKRIRIWW